MSGFFITLEGGEGAGKSTLCKKLAAYFEEKGQKVLITREPGGTPFGESVRSLLLGHEMAPLSELFLLLAARNEHLEQVIKPALSDGLVVLCDRYIDSTIAYQGGGRGLDVDVVSSLSTMFHPLPHLTFFLSAPPQTALKRAQGSDRIEKEALSFHENVFNTFEALSQANPERFVTLDSTKPLHQVFEQALKCLHARSL